MKTVQAFVFILLAVSLLACKQKGGNTEAQPESQVAEKQEAVDSLAAKPSEQLQVEKKEEPAQHFDTNNKYCLIMGAFVVKANAERTFDRLASAGHRPEYIPIGRFTAVGVGAYPSYSEAYRELQRVLQQHPEAPEDTWIYKKR